LGPSGLGERGAIAAVAQAAGLILHLHHDDGVLGVHQPDVAHEGAKGAGIGVARLGAQWAERSGALLLHVGGEKGGHSGIGADVQHHGRKALAIRLHPARHIAGACVFPGGEPDEDEPHVAGSGAGDLGADEGEIEFSLFGLDQFPTDCADDGVEVHGAEFVPDGFHVLDAGGAGVVELAGQHDAGLIVDEELPGCAVLADLG